MFLITQWKYFFRYLEKEIMRNIEIMHLSQVSMHLDLQKDKIFLTQMYQISRDEEIVVKSRNLTLF